MDWRLTIGTLLFLVGIVGYVAGLSVAYPGRAFSVTAVAVGITLAAVGRQAGGDPA